MRGLRKSLIGAALAVALAIPALADSRPPNHSPVPGTLNYVEGQASIGTETLNPKSVGSATLEPGQTLTSKNGRAEILLTPGVFLRAGSDSAVKMISPSLTDTEVEVERGQAQIEVDQIYKQNKLLVREDGATTQLEKNGLYAFDADQHSVRVLDGQAQLLSGDRTVKIKGGREVVLNAPQLKARRFDKKAFEKNDSLYSWSSLRSEYVAQANAEQAPAYVLGGGYGPWWGAGWYWSPFYSCYTFIPGDGFLYNPFGWGFYSPYWAPVYYGVAPARVGPHVRPGAVRVPTARPSWGHRQLGNIGGGGLHAGGGFHAGASHPAGGVSWGRHL